MTFARIPSGSRRTSRFVLAALAGAGLFQAAPGAFAATQASTHSAPKSETQHEVHADSPQKHWGLIEKYCFECHNTTDWAGGIAFDSMSLDTLADDADVWEKSIRRLRGRLMPPPGKPQPEQAQITSLVNYLETSLDAAAGPHPHVGRVGLHRLNRHEYANAVLDLFDLQIDPTALLPRDDAHDGFDNIATALQVSPSFMDQYIGAAQKVASQALGNARALPAATNYTAEGSGTQRFHRDGLPFGTRGGIVVDHYFPADGEYALTIADLAGALWVQNMEFENTVVAMLDGKEFYRTHIGGEQDLKDIDQKQDPAVDAINKRLKNIRFKAGAGTHKVAVAFLERSFAESDARLFTIAPEGGQDKIKRIQSFEVRGPFDPTGVSLTPSRAKIFSCYPRTAAEERPCAEKIVSTLGTRAFRGQLESADQALLMKLYDSGRASGDFELGIKRVVTGLLASPSFLYRADLESQDDKGGGPRQLNDYELASRLSFFLWSSIPDDELLAVAKAGKLHDPAVMQQQVKRMLASPRSETLTTNFAFQWLNVARLDEINPDPRLFPYASGLSDLRSDFKEELRLFVDSVFRADANVLELLSSDQTFVNERLALHYGITSVKGDQFQPVTVPIPARRGLLGKGGVLMLTSYPNRTAPVLRGAWILERISGTPPGTPPPNVGNLPEKVPGKAKATFRELSEAHRQNPRCYACHAVMDPLGFALENFDAVGQYREMDRYTRDLLDTAGQLPDGALVKGPDDLRNALLAKPEQFVQTITEKLMTYGLGRPVEYSDMPTVRRITRELAADNYRFSALITRIVTSDAFQKTAPASAEGKPVELKTAAN